VEVQPKSSKEKENSGFLNKQSLVLKIFLTKKPAAFSSFLISQSEFRLESKIFSTISTQISCIGTHSANV
jgi:hypothetical protein